MPADGPIVVTGAASGIGNATARRLLDQGRTVISLDIKEPTAAVQAHYHCDLSNPASIMASATFGFTRWTQRCGWQLYRIQNGGKHRARLLAEKPLGSCRSVGPGEKKMMHCGETLPLSGQIEPSKLMGAQ